ncbi:MAG TPA: long-chain-fatty-acid--CoA ligase [Thermomicrobiales bacterium]|nr:long-chain-fatty-acid--CoA ligase [Thermomicrobiales bacterium]
MYPPEVYKSYLTPFRFLQRSAAVFREKVAIVHGDQTFTYPQFAARVNQCASALRAHGVQRGDRVAVILPNIPQMLEAHFAVPLAGAILVAINTRLKTDEILYILQHSGASALIVDSELAPMVSPALEHLPELQLTVTVHDSAAGTHLPGPTYDEFLASGSADDLDWPISDEDQVISINYTSGTTGQPKGVMYTHRGVYLNALGELLETRMNSRSVYLWTLPMFHCNGWCYPWAVTAIGGTHICLRKFDGPTTWDLIQKHRVTHLCGAPTVLITMANCESAPTEPLPQELIVSVAAAPPSPAIITQMESMGMEIIHVYGLTEVYGPYTVCAWQEQWDELPLAERSRVKARQGVGYLVADDARVVDAEMNDVSADAQTLGEVVMRGNNTMRGYFEDEAATAQAFRGGWFHSGDLGVMHPDGYIELRDRSKDIIISGGENISTIEVEQAIASHPAVLEVAVIGIPDDRWGETPKAFMVLRAGHVVTADELIAHCKERLAGFKTPRAIEFGELPKTSTGKIQKFALREREWSGHDSRIN